ncbi:MAG: transposase [Planctomycetota bacterium]|jgi:REP element-mobilizing transposase RayT
MLAIGRGFARIIDKCGYAVWACGIMRDHVHMVIRRHHYIVERMVGLLKQGATAELIETGLHPVSGYRKPDGSLPSPWERGCWKSYLNTHEDIELAIEYVEENPRKAGLGRQQWPFVVPVEL